MKHLLPLFFILILSLPTLASAAGVVPCDGPDCQACHVVELGQNLINWFIGIMAVFIALVFVIGGLQMVMSAGNSEGITKGKSMMTNSIIGFFILLGAWLIVDTLLKAVVDNQKLGTWNKINCVTQPVFTSGGNGGSATSTASSTSGGTVTPVAGKLTDSVARTQLSAAGISVNKTAAQGTSLEGINQATIQDAIDLKRDCGCDIVITGGTEGSGGHAAGTMSHSTGYKYDIRLNDTLTTYITTNYQSIGIRSDGAAMYKASDGVIYAREGDHWDVKVPG